MKAFLSYLARDKIYKQEKSFSTDFPVDHIPGARGTNGTGDERLVTMRDIRQCPDIKLDTAGFCLVNFHSRFSADDLVYDEEAKFGYWKEIQQLILSTFPEYKRVECHDLTIRRRAEGFPLPQTEGSRYQETMFEQPASRAHSDITARTCEISARRAYPKHDGYFDGKDFDIINVWRVLIGPNNDWPLGFCDYRTINVENDVRDHDALRVDRLDELSLLHYNEAHQWYYVPSQMPEEAIIFRNANSLGRHSRAFHAAFDNPEASSLPRFSAEVRLAHAQEFFV
ncbi:hypothetical protein KCU92_g1201, partial [Aureobasidium melanogenum]